MFIGKGLEIERRAFLRRSAQLAMMGGAASYALDLAGLAEAAAHADHALLQARHLLER